MTGRVSARERRERKGHRLQTLSREQALKFTPELAVESKSRQPRTVSVTRQTKWNRDSCIGTQGCNTIQYGWYHGACRQLRPCRRMSCRLFDSVEDEVIRDWTT